MSIEADEIKRDMEQQLRDRAYELNESVIQCKVIEEVDQLIMKQDSVWYESMGCDAWSLEIETEIARACFHNDATKLGNLILKASRLYLTKIVQEEIDSDWHKYVREN